MVATLLLSAWAKENRWRSVWPTINPIRRADGARCYFDPVLAWRPSPSAVRQLERVQQPAIRRDRSRRRLDFEPAALRHEQRLKAA